MKYNHALSLLALAVHAHRSGQAEVAAKSFAQAANHKSVADVLETASVQLKARKKAALAAKAAKPASAVAALSQMAKEIAEAEDADKPGEDLRIEVEDDVVTMAEAEDGDDDGDDDSDDGDDKEETARFAKALSNLKRSGK